LSPVELAWYPVLTRAVRALPFSGRIERSYLRLAFTNRLAGPISLLQRIHPREAVRGEVPDLAEGWKRYGEPFREDPLYAPYAEDYLLS
jgi:hypothetical protein